MAEGERAEPSVPSRSGRRPRGPSIAVLRQLAVLGALKAPISATSREVGTRVGCSQQAADRHLLALEAGGYVERQIAARRQSLQITARGADLLREEYEQYKRIFEGAAAVRFRGVVASGLGEGRYYLSQSGYAVQFKARLGYDPYAGTLNVAVGPDAAGPLAAIRKFPGIRIEGFQAGERTFGGATCHAARVNGRACHIIMPDRTHHQNVVELIAPDRLRDSLSLSDGDRVEVEMEAS